MTNNELTEIVQNVHKIAYDMMNRGKYDECDIFRLANCVALLSEVIAQTNQITLVKGDD